jgi:hypothetical protein
MSRDGSEAWSSQAAAQLTRAGSQNSAAPTRPGVLYQVSPPTREPPHGRDRNSADCPDEVHVGDL